MINISSAAMRALSQAFCDTFNGGFIRIFTGAPPPTSNAAESGTLLGVVTLDAGGGGLVFVASDTYASNPPNARWAYTGVAAGNAGYFRLVAPGDTGTVSASEPRIDGTIGLPMSGADVELDTLAVALGVTYTLDSFVYIVHPLPRTAT